MSAPKTAAAKPSVARERVYLATLALSVGAVSVCGIIYQLIIGTVSTYLQGNSTYQFSMTIGMFMSAYGVGSFASTKVRAGLLDRFILIELLIGFFGGVASVVLFYLYATSELFEVGRVVLILVLGTLVGLEIPLLIRITEQYRKNLRLTVGQMMGFDYLGALLGGVGFPLVLLPWWGLVGSGLWVGLFNTAVAVALLAVFWGEVRRARWLAGACALVALCLGAAVGSGGTVERTLERTLYEDPVVHVEQSAYQKIVMTRLGDDLRLYLDGALQLASLDEYRYHEALVHPAAARLERPRDVLVLGGGDGLALRELRRHASVESVVLVDLDPAVVRLARTHPMLSALNARAFETTPVEVVHDDAFVYVRALARDPGGARFDLIVIDLPDPHDASLAKLYSVAFYRDVRRVLRPGGLMAAQLGSPFFGNRAFWTAVATLREAGWAVEPYHLNVPSFGEWGFALGSPQEGGVPEAPRRALKGRYYDTRHDGHLFVWPDDLRARTPVTPNTLIRPVIVEAFRQDWRAWN